MAYGCCAGLGDSGIAALDGMGQYTLSFNPGISEVPPGQPWYASIVDGPSYNPGMSFADVPQGQPWYADIITGAIQAGTQIAQDVLAPGRLPQVPAYPPGYGYPPSGGPGGPYLPGVPTTAPIYQQGTYIPSYPAPVSGMSSYLPWVLGGGALLFLLMNKRKK